LPAHASETVARDEWRDIVEGRSMLWKGIPIDRKETIRVNYSSGRTRTSISVMEGRSQLS